MEQATGKEVEEVGEKWVQRDREREAAEGMKWEKDKKRVDGKGKGGMRS